MPLWRNRGLPEHGESNPTAALVYMLNRHGPPDEYDRTRGGYATWLRVSSACMDPPEAKGKRKSRHDPPAVEIEFDAITVRDVQDIHVHPRLHTDFLTHTITMRISRWGKCVLQGISRCYDVNLATQQVSATCHTEESNLTLLWFAAALLCEYPELRACKPQARMFSYPGMYAIGVLGTKSFTQSKGSERCKQGQDAPVRAVLQDADGARHGNRESMAAIADRVRTLRDYINTVQEDAVRENAEFYGKTEGRGAVRPDVESQKILSRMSRKKKAPPPPRF